MIVRATCPECPDRDGGTLLRAHHSTGGNTYRCERCGHHWVISVGSAEYVGRRNVSAPFYPLVELIDSLLHPKKVAG
jgi:hypothetical protein